MQDVHNRRAFLRAVAAAGAAWATADLADVDSALVWAAQQNAGANARTVALTPAQADVVIAATGRLLPAVDGRPGAREAGVVYFVDKALSTFNAAQKPMYISGLADLDRRAGAARRGALFAALEPAQQDAILHEIEETPFFGALRLDTIVGTFALPAWGGNKDYAGWHLIGLDHQPRFQAPFGYYDAEAKG